MSYMSVDTIGQPAMNVQGITLPNEPLTNFQLMETVNKRKIPNFRGVFLRNELPRKPKRNECGILNLDDDQGTHWIWWYRKCDEKRYFDSYGVRLPEELLSCLKSPIYYCTE